MYLFDGDNGGVHVLLLDVPGNPDSKREKEEAITQQRGAEGDAEGGKITHLL